MPSNKKFGKFFSFILLIISLFYFYKLNIFIAVFFAIFSMITLILALFADKYLKPFNNIWFKFGMILNYIISPIVLGIIFFGILSPLSLVLKIFKRDELNMKIVKNVSSWKKYKQDETNKTNFINQF